LKPEKDIADFFRTYRDRVMDQTRQQRYAVIKRVSLARGLLKGEPVDWYDGVGWRWRAAEEFPEYSKETAPRYRRHINIYQAAWQILNGALHTAGVPGSVFIPQNEKQEMDKAAARIAKPIIDYERSVIDYSDLWQRLFQKFFTDGPAVLYARHVRDGARWGYRTERREVETPYRVREAGYDCFMCGDFTQPGMTQRGELGGIFCPKCGDPMHAENYAEPIDKMLNEVQEQKVPKGREMVEIFGLLESPLPWWVGKLENCPYVPIITDVQREYIIRAFTDSEDELRGVGQTEEIREQLARQRAKSPQYGAPDASTELFFEYGRWWFQPEVFYSETDRGKRREMLAEYGQGAFVQFAGDICLDAVDEAVADHIEIARPLPGDGMHTPSLGQNGVPIQLAVDTAFNLQLEGVEYAAFGPVLVNSLLMNPEALQGKKPEPFQVIPVLVPPGMNLRDAVYQVEVKDISASVQSLIEQSFRWMEHLVGATAALAGAAMKNARTAEQYATAKNQALQRLAPPYENAKRSLAKIDEILVHEVLKNRSDEELKEIVAGRMDRTMMETLLAPRQGRIFARAEQSESVPQTWGQKQAAISELLQSQNPLVQRWIGDPNNAELIFRAKGLPELTVGQDMKGKMEMLLPLLLQGAPIPFDSVMDDPVVATSFLRKWAATPEGFAAQRENQTGFMNVRRYVEEAAITMVPPQPGPAPGQGQPAMTR